MKNIILILAAWLCAWTSLRAQVEPRTKVNDYLDAYIGTNAKPYIQPLADLVTANIHTGAWDWASIPDKFYFRIKANGMLSIPKESMRTFTGHTSGDFTPEQSLLVPTIIGDQTSIILQGDNKSVYLFPGGFDLEQIALGTPQLILGGLFNTEISGRFLSFPISDDDGVVVFYGIGGRHAITGWFENPPFDLSVGYFYHHIKAGTYLNSDQHLYSLQLGKTGKMLSGYISAGYQSALHRLRYTYDDGGDPYYAKLDLKNENPLILEGGMGLKLGPVFFNGAISYASFPSFVVGAGLSF